MNFNIIDGDNDYTDLLPEFIKLYNNTKIPVHEIPDMLGVNLLTYRKLRRDAHDAGMIKLRRKPNKKKPTYKTHPKYYCKCIGNGGFEFHVMRTINGKQLYFGNFKKEKHAKRMVELLDEYGWDKSMAGELKKKVLMEDLE